MMTIYEIIVKIETGKWCLECIANDENYQEILEQKRKEFPDKEFDAKRLTKEEQENAWYFQGWLD